MASSFLCSKPLAYDVVSLLPYSLGLHPGIPLKPSALAGFFLHAPFPPFSARLSSRLHASMLLDKIPQRRSFHDKTSLGSVALEKEVGYPPSNVGEDVLLFEFISSRHGKEEGNENLKKAVHLDKVIKKEKKGRKTELSSEEVEFMIGLDMCSKAGDVFGAISLYEAAVEKGLHLQKYHYNVLLYLCSSASTGFIYTAKSVCSDGVGCSSDVKESDYELKPQNIGEQRGGSWQKQKLRHLGSHLNNFETNVSFTQKELRPRTNDFKGEIIKVMRKSSGGVPVRLSDDLRAYARRKGFEIYEKMCLEKVQVTEATMKSVARMAMSKGDGDMTFEIVKQMKAMGMTPRLRSYGPSIPTFSSCGSVDKVFEVERHMFELGIRPEEHELEALLTTSVKARRGDTVYYLLHKLRTIVRQVSPSTADVIDVWFRNSTASRVGKRKWDNQVVKKAVENGGGGWHGLGWLGIGKWDTVRTVVNDEGVCLCCREKLVTIDLDPIETENFAKSVESIVVKRERNSKFEEFKRWLEYYGPFEAVVDAANVGLFNQRQFSINKVNAVANAIRQKLPLKKWPLIIVHNKRLFGGKMSETFNKNLIEKWKNADAIYATPTGSNDDWYWLYAAIKCKCLVVTNDEMRDHLFHVLGNDFFAKWKERYQVHFIHQDGSFQFLMPPPFSVVIQESDRGHWHIPIKAHEQGSNRIWMCVTRASSHVIRAASSTPLIDRSADVVSKFCYSDAKASKRFSSVSSSKHQAKKIKNRSEIFTAAGKFPKSWIMSAIEDAENTGGCIIDFEI